MMRILFVFFSLLMLGSCATQSRGKDSHSIAQEPVKAQASYEKYLANRERLTRRDSH